MMLVSRFLLPSLVILLVCGACERGGGGHGAKGAETLAATDAATVMVRGERILMGTSFEIQLVTGDEDKASQDIEAVFDDLAVLEARISEWRPDSEISLLNSEAGKRPVAVGPELHEIIRKAVAISAQTDGAFDISFASCARYWSFRDERIPSADELSACLAAVDYRRISLVPETREVYLPADMRIGIGGIGKGYGVDHAARFLEARGYRTYLINGGGDIRVRGKAPEHTWHLGITDPRHPPRARGRDRAVLGRLSLQQGALAGSGDYEQFFERDGVRYHHILDPATGMPARASVAVQVIAPTALEADAYATAFFVLGPERAIEIADGLPGVDCLVMDASLDIHMTAGFRTAYHPPE